MKPTINSTKLRSACDRNPVQLVARHGLGARLDAKTLIALAVAITMRCDGCIAVHTTAAKKVGATKEEISEALGVGITSAKQVQCGVHHETLLTLFAHGDAVHNGLNRSITGSNDIDLTQGTPPNFTTVSDDPFGTLVKYGHAFFHGYR